MLFTLPILLTIVLTSSYADSTDLSSATASKRRTQEKTIIYKTQTTCGKIDYRNGIFKRWDDDDQEKPTTTGKCRGQCRQAGFDNCKGFVYYYRKKTCLLLNYEADRDSFKSHTSAACGYWIDVTPAPTTSIASSSMPTPSQSPTQPICKAEILLKFAKTPNEVPTMGHHNDYLVVTKTSKNQNRTYESCCFNQVEQPWGCTHDGRDAQFFNFADDYYDFIDSEKVIIPRARGGQFILESKHFFNRYEANYYGQGYADHSVPAKMIVSVNGEVIKRFSHPKNKGRNTHILPILLHQPPDINPDYIGYIRAKLRCDRNCDCKVVVFRNAKRPRNGVCDIFPEDGDGDTV